MKLHIVRVITLLILAAISAGLIYILIRGIPGVIQLGTPIGVPLQRQAIVQDWYFPAIIPLSATGVMTTGLLLSLKNPRAIFVSWVGLAALAATGVLLIWSIGFYIIILAILLLGPLAVLQTTNDGNHLRE